jgi:hypothetical protein
MSQIRYQWRLTHDRGLYTWSRSRVLQAKALFPDKPAFHVSWSGLVVYFLMNLAVRNMRNASALALTPFSFEYREFSADHQTITQRDTQNSRMLSCHSLHWFNNVGVP